MGWTPTSGITFINATNFGTLNVGAVGSGPSVVLTVANYGVLNQTTKGLGSLTLIETPNTWLPNHVFLA
jgi:hypothetical protein